MIKMLSTALLLFPLFAVAADPAFEAGASFGKGNAAAGTGALKNPGAVTGAIPGYTANPPEKGYYGGVNGGDGGLAGKGQAALQGNDAAQSVISSGTKNPTPTIDPNAPFITIGKNAEGTADGIMDGSSQQCKETTVSKSTFENFTCDRDVAVIQTCGRTASITGHYEDNYSYRTITIDSDNLDVSSPEVTYTMPEGTVYSAKMSYTFRKDLAFSNDIWYLNITTLGRLMTMYETSGSYELSPGKSFSEGEALTITINNKQNIPERVVNVWKDGKRNQMYHFVITIVYRTGTKVWVPQMTWTESCGFDKKSALSSAGSICTEPGGTRTITVEGKEYSQTNS